MENKTQTSATLKSVEISRKSSNKFERLSFDERQHLIELKKNLADKVFRDLSRKFYKLIRDNNYDLNNFIRDFEKEMKTSYDFNNPDYKVFFRKLENVFLKKMKHLEDKKKLNNDGYSDEDIEFKKSINTNCKVKKKLSMDYSTYSYGKGYSIKNIDHFKNQNDKHTFVKDQIKIIYSPKKEELIRKRTEDEWAQIINNDYNNYVKENALHKEKAKNLKMEYSKKLLNQIKEKEDQKKMELEKERKFHEEVYLKKLQEEENNDIFKLQNFRRKCLENKISSIRQYTDSLNRKRKNNEEEKNLDNLMNEFQIKSNKTFEKENNININKAKRNFEEINNQNEYLTNVRKENLLKQKEEDKQYSKAYTKMLDDLEEKRKNQIKAKNENIKNYTTEEFYSKFIDINEISKKHLQNINEKTLNFEDKK